MCAVAFAPEFPLLVVSIFGNEIFPPVAFAVAAPRVGDAVPVIDVSLTPIE